MKSYNINYWDLADFLFSSSCSGFVWYSNLKLFISNGAIWAAEGHLLLMYEQLHQQSGEMWDIPCRRDHLQVLHEPGKKTQTESLPDGPGGRTTHYAL